MDTIATNQYGASVERRGPRRWVVVHPGGTEVPHTTMRAALNMLAGHEAVNDIETEEQAWRDSLGERIGPCDIQPGDVIRLPVQVGCREYLITEIAWAREDRQAAVVLYGRNDCLLLCEGMDIRRPIPKESQ